MNITTKGHIENINNDKITTNSWDGRWDETQGSGSIATINTNKKGDEPTNVVEDYKPIADVKELNPYMNNDPRMDHYFALRTIPRKITEPVHEVHDDTYTPKNTGALVDKLESLLNKDPKVLVFKPQPYTPLTPTTHSSSSSMSNSRERKRSNKHYATPKRKTSNVQTRKKKTPTPKKNKTFIPPTVSLRKAVKKINP